MSAALNLAEVEGGERLGAGAARDVFVMHGRPDAVLKVESRRRDFCNVMEWKLWEAARTMPAGQWLAPCLEISGDGRSLMMRRTLPMPDRVWASLRVPSFFEDVTPENWGLLEGRPVCHDYASTAALAVGLCVSELRRAASLVWLRRRGLDPLQSGS